MRSRLLLITPLFIFGIAGLLLYWRFMTPGAGPFHDNLLPELIGFCLEGFVLVGLLSLVQASRERERRKQLWLSLRGSLRDFLSQLDLALLEADAEPAATEALEQQPELVTRLAEKLSSTELELSTLTKLKQLGGASGALSRDLIAVAAQLSTEHMRSWISITDSLGKLAGAPDREQLERAASDLLQHLGRFDALRY